MNAVREERSLIALAIALGFMIAFVDGRMPVPGFPARAVILSCFVLGWLRPSRPWQWAAIIAGILVLVHGLRSTVVSDWYWTQIHSIAWLGNAYDRLGTPGPVASGLWVKAIAFFPGLAAALLGRWCGEWVSAYRAQAQPAVRE